jgi:poly(3-hydroxybutyrate) depolymerase
MATLARRLPGPRRLAAVAALALVAVAPGCDPVTPSVPFEHGSFEGFDVVSYVPDHPRGLVYLFHGSYGSADFATRVETVDTLNELIARGYGFVATESTERTGTKRWDVFDPSLATNPDLARLTRLQAHLVATTPVEAGTPLLGLGMSNGARFVSLWGETWAGAGYPVRAIAMVMGTIAPPVTAAGGLDVPTFFVTAENDVTSPPGPIIADHGATAARGTPTDLIVAREQPLTAARFLRIPGIDAEEATAVVDALVATGAWDAAGQRLVPVDEAVARAEAVTLPPAVRPEAAEIGNQVALVLAVHQMRGDVKVPVAEFFDRHR